MYIVGGACFPNMANLMVRKSLWIETPVILTHPKAVQVNYLFSSYTDPKRGLFHGYINCFLGSQTYRPQGSYNNCGTGSYIGCRRGSYIGCQIGSYIGCHRGSHSCISRAVTLTLAEAVILSTSK